MLYTIKHFVSHRLHQTADMSNTGLLINLLLLQPHRIKNKKKLTGGSQHQRQETIYIRSPFFVPSSCPSLLPQPLIRRNPRQDKVGNPQTSVGHLGPASQLCSGARGALTCSAAESRLPAHAAAGPRLSRRPCGCEPAPAPHSGVPSPQDEPPALPAPVPALWPALPAGRSAVRPELRERPRLRTARLRLRLRDERLRARSGAQRSSRPQRCGREYTDWIRRGSGRGRRGVPGLPAPLPLQDAARHQELVMLNRASVAEGHYFDKL